MGKKPPPTQFSLRLSHSAQLKRQYCAIVDILTGEIIGEFWIKNSVLTATESAVFECAQQIALKLTRYTTQQTSFFDPIKEPIVPRSGGKQ